MHELYLQLPSVQHLDWQSRAQFLNVAARMMRNILVDHARKRHAAKRGGGVTPVIVDAQVDDPALKSDVLVINDALDRLSEHYPRQSRVVELRFFGGLTTEETCQVLDGDRGGMFAAHRGTRLDLRAGLVAKCHRNQLIPSGSAWKQLFQEAWDLEAAAAPGVPRTKLAAAMSALRECRREPAACLHRAEANPLWNETAHAQRSPLQAAGGR